MFAICLPSQQCRFDIGTLLYSTEFAPLWLEAESVKFAGTVAGVAVDKRRSKQACQKYSASRKEGDWFPVGFVS